MKSRFDYYFILSLLLIMILGAYVSYNYFQRQKLNEYLQVLHNTISDMVPDEKSRRVLDEYFSDLLAHADEDSISPKQLEKLADNIISIRSKKEKIQAEDLKKILIVKNQKDISKTRISTAGTLFDKKQPDWQKLNKQFKTQFARIDSLQKEKQKSIKKQQALHRQIMLHESISNKHNQNYEKAQGIYDSVKRKFREQETPQISLKEQELLKMQLVQLKLENERLSKKINALSEIQTLIDNERVKMQGKLALIDSLKKETN